ncbi:MAG: peptidoglycan editing factor PgeF [Sphaerobacter thermophilus]|uniref:peptidoglycan editing factor PgeF n=1 Tax=Sphaerobacter thermophilus TaxID=2057 RepID=UPI000DB22A5C|nr:MAG: peptidoglycan editing factor PgeF [Sphaerobacter thermophilus]
MVRHGITGRTSQLPAEGTVTNRPGLDPAIVTANRAAWSAAIGVDAACWTYGRQVHGAQVALVSRNGHRPDMSDDTFPPGTWIQGRDAFVTAEPGIPVVAFCADCVPILLHDPKRGAVAAIHAGWRGTVADVVGATVRTMQERLGCDPRDLIAGLGPSIGPCCYEVGDEVIEAWRATGLDPDGHAVRRVDNRTIFDLWHANRSALIAAGVPAEQIEVSGVCTRCNADRFFSHRSRRATGAPPASFAAVIALVPQGAEQGAGIQW